MVMIRYDSSIAEINGKAGNDVYRHDWCGNHIQHQVYDDKPASKWQKIDHAAFLKCLQTWKLLALAINRYLVQHWRAYAREHPVSNKKGELIILSPFNMFMSVNMERVLSGFEPQLTPYPELEQPPGLPDVFTYISGVGIHRIVLVFPQPMETGARYTPAPDDFVIWLAKHRTTSYLSVYWNNQYQLYIEWIEVYPIATWFSLKYRQGSEQISTQAGRWYRSFEVEYNE